MTASTSVMHRVEGEQDPEPPFTPLMEGAIRHFLNLVSELPEVVATYRDQTPEDVAKEWLRTQPPNKQRRLKPYVEGYWLTDCSSVPCDATQWPEHARILAFTKREALPKKGARVIFPMDPAVNALIGPAVHQVSHRLVRCRFLLKGANLDERCAKLSRLVGVALVSTDFSLYDKTMRSIVRKFEQAVVEVFSPYFNDAYRRFVAMVRTATIRHLDGVLISKGWRRLSGEMGTSIFNGLFNAFRVFWACVYGAGIGLKPVPFSFDLLFVEGDDCLDANTPAERVVAGAKSLGLVVTIEEDRTLLTAPFLGRYHYLEGEKLRSMCDIWRTLGKFHYSSRPAAQVTKEELLAAKSLAYLATDPTTPVVSAVAWAFANRHKPSRAALEHYAHRLWVSGRDRRTLVREAPVPTDSQWACAVRQTGVQIDVLRDKHMEWVAFGSGFGPQPGPLCRWADVGHMVSVDRLVA